MKTQLRVEYNADTLLALLGLPTLATIALAAPAPLKSVRVLAGSPGLPSYAVLRVIDGEKLGKVRYTGVVIREIERWCSSQSNSQPPCRPKD